MRVYLALILFVMSVLLCVPTKKCVTPKEYDGLIDLYARAITTNKHSCLKKFHGELGEEDPYLTLLLVDKRDDKFQIMLEQSSSVEEKTILYTMTIPDSIFLYVYSSKYDTPLSLYYLPDRRYIMEQCEDYIIQPLQITDVYETWLKVQFKESGKEYIGWIPAEEYCSNPYTTCN